MRGQARDYDGWARRRLGDDRAGAGTTCLPYFKQHEDYYRGADAFHAAPGFDPTGKRRRRRMARREAAPALGHPRRLRRGRAAGRHPAHRRLQPRRQRRRRLLRGQPARRHALERDQGLPAADASAGPTCRSGPARTSTRLSSSTPTGRRASASRSRRPAAARRHGDARAARRGDPRRRRDRHAADPAALGHRPGARCCRRTASRSRHDLPGVGENLQDHLQIRAVFGVEGVKTLNTLAQLAAGARR